MYRSICISPVSYTHLDVYKRQDISFTPLVNSNIPLIKALDISDLRGRRLNTDSDITEKNIIQLPTVSIVPIAENIAELKLVCDKAVFGAITFMLSCGKDVYKRQGFMCADGTKRRC